MTSKKVCKNIVVADHEGPLAKVKASIHLRFSDTTSENKNLKKMTQLVYFTALKFFTTRGEMNLET